MDNKPKDSKKEWGVTGWYPKTADELRFYLKHLIQKVMNDDPTKQDHVFQGCTQMHDRESDRHGYNPGADLEVYESDIRDAVRKLREAKLEPVPNKDRKVIGKGGKVANAERVKDFEAALHGPMAQKANAERRARNDLNDRAKKMRNEGRSLGDILGYNTEVDYIEHEPTLLLAPRKKGE